MNQPLPQTSVARMPAFILAGGQGTRLGPLTAACAKPAMPMAGGRRLIDFTLSNCVNSGIRRVGVLTQYQAASLGPHVHAHWSARRATDPLVKCLAAATDSYRGTADAVRQQLAWLRSAGADHVLILAGDHVYRMDYQVMLEGHIGRGAALTVGCIPVPVAEASAFGVMSVDDSQRITHFVEKPSQPLPVPGNPSMALASMGIYIFDARFLAGLLEADCFDPRSSHDFGKNIIPAAIAAGRVHAHALTDFDDHAQAGYWRDVGTIDTYRRTNLELVMRGRAFDPDDLRWPIRGSAPGVLGRAPDASGSVLMDGVRVGRGTHLEGCVVLPGAVIGEDCSLKDCVVGRDCVIPRGTRIGEDLAADRSRFHVAPGGSVLVTAGMPLYQEPARAASA